MEGKLIPNYHYIEVAADFHDITERVLYYDAHPEEVKSIVEHAHEWVKQFKNKEREDIIALLTLRRYFIQTGQSVD
jgi:spore maturation protein CgeB